VRLTYGGDYRNFHYPHNDMFSDLREVQVSWRYYEAEFVEYDGPDDRTGDLTKRLRITFGKDDLRVGYAKRY
jgi:hypothetical protein